MSGIRIGIDASNVGGGGGVTHLKEILGHFDFVFFKDVISEIIVFSSQAVLDQVDENPILTKRTYPALNKGLLSRVKFQLFNYDKEIKQSCDILLSITGDYVGGFKPLVGFSRNMLLYERDIWKEIGSFKEVSRFWLNFRKQKKCFNNAESLIFLSNYAKDYIQDCLSIEYKKATIIHHGVANRFMREPRLQRPITAYSFDQPFKFMYISTVHVYKHQWTVINAIKKIRDNGYPVELDLIGGVIFEPAGNKLSETIAEIDPNHDFIHWHGNKSYTELDKSFNDADGLIFASTCENMPNTLIEYMASGLPIACSNKQPMPEFLGDNEFYFDAKNEDSIVESVVAMLNDVEGRTKMVEKNVKEAAKYSWFDTSKATFTYLVESYKNSINV